MATHCNTCGHACEECARIRARKATQLCACGCGRSMSGKRRQAKFATERCKDRSRYLLRCRQQPQPSVEA